MEAKITRIEGEKVFAKTDNHTLRWIGIFPSKEEIKEMEIAEKQRYELEIHPKYFAIFDGILKYAQGGKLEIGHRIDVEEEDGVFVFCPPNRWF